MLLGNASASTIEIAQRQPPCRIGCRCGEWPLIVELDCYEYHRTPQEFENDRRRDAHLKRNGDDVLRVTDVWLDSDPEDVAQTVRTLLTRPG